MNIIINLIISFFIAGFAVLQLSLVAIPLAKAKNEAYQWWYMPWLALLYSLLMGGLYAAINLPKFLTKLPLSSYQVEVLYCIVVWLIWIPLQYVLRKPTVQSSLLKLYRKLFAKGEENALPFPYFQTNDGVRVRVGQKFYRWTLKTFVLVLAAVYASCFLIMSFTKTSTMFLVSSFALLGLLPIIEYYIYLCADVPTEEIETPDVTPPEETVPKRDTDFDNLWKHYVDTFNNYVVAWRRKNPLKDQVQELLQDQDEAFCQLLDSFRNHGRDCIIENYDLVSAFTRLEPFFSLVSASGRYVLIAMDVPKRQVRQNTSEFDEIARRLSELLHTTVVGYKEELPRDHINNSIVVAPLTQLLRQKMDEQWIKKIGLVTVVNVSDKGVSNMYECRKFSFFLKSVNPNFRMIFITPNRRGMEPAMANTWLTGVNMDEQKIRRFSVADRLYLIGYNAEDFRDRFRHILSTGHDVTLYSGSEMAPIALSPKFGNNEQNPISVHYFELAYSNAIESKEELKRHLDLIDTELLSVSAAAVQDRMVNHFLQLDPIKEEQILSVVYDHENNAPAAYLKWLHLGTNDNFTIVVSKPYLFRDYFNANHDYFTVAPFVSFQPHLCKSRITLAIILFHLLQQSEVEERDLKEFLNRYYDERDIRSISALVQNLFREYFDIDLQHGLWVNERVSFDGVQYQHQTFYSVTLSDSIRLSYLDIISVKDMSGNMLFEIPQDLLYQNYNKGQIHSFSGRPYKIGDFDETNRTLTVSTADSIAGNVLFYKYVQEVSLLGERTEIKGMDVGAQNWNHRITGEKLSLHVECIETCLTVKTTSWYEFTKYSRLGDACTFRETNMPVREYKKGKVLKVMFAFMHKPRYLTRKEDIRKGLQILLYESMQSLFPHHAQYLIVSSLGDGDADLPWIFNTFNCDDKDEKNTLSFYFSEDAHIDLGLIGALSNRENIKYLFRYLYDYLTWLPEAGAASAVPGYDEYRNRTNLDKTAFLKYGRNSLPSYFDVDLLINFIRDFFGEDVCAPMPKGGRDKNEVYGFCDFCGKRFKNSEMTQLKDGRMRCKECAQNAVDDDKSFQLLCKQAKDLFKTHLGIDFDNIPHSGKLISAVELHKMGGKPFSITTGYDVRQLVGLACDSVYDEFFVENGRKPQDTFGIICHEMTHIWQYNAPEFATRLGDKNWMEGLAVWTDLFLSECYGKPNIDSLRKGWLVRTDEYGIGLQFIMEHCPEDPYKYIRENQGR